jgi:hypothetical protein
MVGVFYADAGRMVQNGPKTAVIFAANSHSRMAAGETSRDRVRVRTIHFSSASDPRVVLPPDHTFRASDGGVATFSAGVTLFTPSDQPLTVADSDSGITGSIIVTL